MSNDIHVRVTADDDTGPGFGSATRGAKSVAGQLDSVNAAAGKMVKGLLAVGVAGPALVGVAGVAAGMGAAFAGAGAALGVFGAVVKSTFGDVAEASKTTADLRDKMDQAGRMAEQADAKMKPKYLAEQKRLMVEYKAELANLPAPMGAAVGSLDRLKGAWQKFKDANQADTLGFLTRGFNNLSFALPKLQPLFDAGAAAADQAMGAFGRFVGAGGLDRVVKYLTTQAIPTLKQFGGIFLSFGSGIKTLLSPLKGAGDGVVESLDKMSLSFATWAQESGKAGVEKFLASMKDNGPGAGDLMKSLAEAALKVAQAMGPLIPITVAIAASLASIINALPPGVITALVAGVIALSAAMKVLAVSTAIVNAVMAVNPVGAIIIGVIALAVAFKLAWDHSETFRRIVINVFKVAATIILTYIEIMVRGVLEFFGAILHGAAKAFGWVPGIGDKLKAADAAFRGMREQVYKQFDAMKTKVQEFGREAAKPVHKNVTVRVIDNATGRLRSITREVDALTGRVVAIQVGAVGRGPRAEATGGVIGAAAAGGVRGGLTWVGERGPELLRIPSGSQMWPAGTSQVMAGQGGGGGGEIHITLNLGTAKLGKVILDPLRKTVRGKGGLTATFGT